MIGITWLRVTVLLSTEEVHHLPLASTEALLREAMRLPCTDHLLVVTATAVLKSATTLVTALSVPATTLAPSRTVSTCATLPGTRVEGLLLVAASQEVTRSL